MTFQTVADQQVLEIGYLLKYQYWHQGYAIEAAQACKKYAFDNLHADAVYSIIRTTNEYSKRVAIQNGMQYMQSLRKYYYGMDMPHEVFRITEKEYRAEKRLKG